jgi:glycosyltransferase involved in cell wall biosynthesis
MRSHELAAAAATWPAELKLVFQSHTHLGRHDQYAQSLTQIGKGHVLLSAAPVSYDQLDDLYSSARIGLVIYDTSLGPNFTLLAGASGKLAHCLRCGVPVISIDNQSIGRVLTQFGCGIAVDSPGEVAAAIQQILADYERYRNNALNCYRSEYEFDKHFAAVLQRIDTRQPVQSRNTSRGNQTTP